jgi:hypothetical protein
MSNLRRNDLHDIITEVVSTFKDDNSSWLLEAPQALEEGVYDPGILKAVFTAGGPGSGKSYTADIIFGVRDDEGDKLFKKASIVADTGLKYVNSDLLFEKGLRRAGINPKLLGTIAEEQPDLWAFIQDPTDPGSIRSIAKQKLSKIRGYYESGRLGMLVDGTGKNYLKVERDKRKLEELGYDTYMLFVDTALAVAIDRDAERSRSLGARKVTELWDQVQRNKDRLAELFSPNFDIVNNDEFGPPPKEIASALNNFVAEPVQNPLGQAWINHELEQRSK